jgi:predicted metal-dependent hydrolase
MIRESERSQVLWGRTEIPYAIRRSPRRATVSIAVEPTGEVVLTAPTTAPLDRLDRIVHAKARWIVERLRRTSEVPPPLPSREFISGETFLYLGRQYRLRVASKVEESGEVALRRGWLVAPVPEAREGSDRAECVRAALVAWYKTRAAERLPERADTWSKKLGIPLPRVIIREPRKRWGSCDAKGTLRFNWRVIQSPMRLVDYVVAHELVHLRHPDHTKEFWATLGRVMPDYESRRHDLKRLGPLLDWSY